MSKAGADTTSVSPVLAPNSLETQPPSPAILTSSSSTSRPAQANRTKAPTRTYGKRTVAEPVEEEEQGREESRLEGKKSLERQSTVVVPETDFDFDIDMDEGRSRRHEDERKDRSRSSSPPKSDLHSTSPTSTEGEEERDRTTGGAGKKISILDGLSDSDSSDDDEGEGGAIAYFDKHKSVAEMLAQVDQELNDREDSPPPPPLPLVGKSTSTTKYTAPPTSSSLPPLTDSDAQTRDSSSSQPTPLAGLRQSSSVHILDAEESQEVLRPTARTKKSRARIVDSEDEEEQEGDEDDLPHVRDIPAPQARRSTVPESSDHESDASPVRPSHASTTLSKKERIQALADKKKKAAAAKAAPPARKEEKLSSAIEDDSSEGEQDKASRKKGKKVAGKVKVKSLSKKVEDEMNKQSAAFARAQEVRIEPILKTRMTVAETLSKKSTRPQSVAPPPARHTAAIVTLDTSDPIQDASSPSTLSTHARQPSANALGKRRARSPVILDDEDSTPVPRRKLVGKPDPSWRKKLVRSETKDKNGSDGDDDDELLSIDEMLELRKKQEQEKKAKEKAEIEKRKKREEMIKAARAKAAAAGDDDESDLEIEGLPMLAPRPPPAPRRTSAEAFRRAAATPRPGIELNHVLRDFAHVDPMHHPTADDDPSDSQIHRAGREFGRNLEPNHHVVPSPIRTSKTKPSKTSKANQPAAITQEQLLRNLTEKAQRQAIETRMEKMSAQRRQQQEQASGERSGPARVDVKGMMEKKKQQQVEDEVLEDEEDPDYQAGFDEDEEEEAQASEEEDDEMGSGSEIEAGAGVRAEDGGEEEEGEVDSEGEPIMPRSSQNSERFGHAGAIRTGDGDDDDDDEELDSAPVARRAKRVIADEEEEEDEEDVQRPEPIEPTCPATEVVAESTDKDFDAAAAPVKFAFTDLLGGAGAGDDGGGFSQFFDSQFSQDVGKNNDTEGFARPREGSPFRNLMPTMLAPQPLISTAERLADAALLEARGAIHNLEPGTPGDAAVPRQYVNKQGFMTQTRPVNLFGDSPSDSPRDSQFRESMSTTRDSQSQRITQTQVDATPTQAFRGANQLRRFSALVAHDSETESQLDPTEAADETQEESFPSAAQTAAPRDAFAVLRNGAQQALAPIPEKVKTRRERNAFVDTEANLSDEEMGMGAPSGDEDEDGHDAELEDLVDNEEVAAELALQQDKLARERYQEDAEKAEAAALKKAQNIAGGKERNKRRDYDLSDDDFDDEYKRDERREKKARIDTLTTAELHANEKTRPFAAQLTDTCTIRVKEGDYDFLEESQPQSDHEGDDEEIELREEDVFGAEVLPRVKIHSYKDVREEAIRRQRERDELELDREERELQMDFHLGNSSSPAVPIRVNNRVVTSLTRPAAVTRDDNFDEIDSQYSYHRTDSIHMTVKYKTGDSKDESQGGNGVAAGSRSAITSFKRSNPATKSSTSLSANPSLTNVKSANSSRTALGPKTSKMSFRNNKFA